MSRWRRLRRWWLDWLHAFDVVLNHRETTAACAPDDEAAA